jgi:putative transcriptional regulator
MISHHPDIDLLLEYSAGGSPFPLAMLLHMHLQYCSACRHSLRKLEIIGGEFFGASPEGQIDPVDEHAFDRVMALIEAEEAADLEVGTAGVEHTYFRKNFPQSYGAGNTVSSLALEKLLPKRFSTIDWKRKWLGVFEHVIATGGDKPSSDNGADESLRWKLALQRTRKGCSAPKHVHSNCEYTVVLQGGYSDAAGVYREGDFVVRTPESTHRPRAMEDQDCICLSYIQGKIGLFNPLSGPLTRFRQRLS